MQMQCLIRTKNKEPIEASQLPPIDTHLYAVKPRKPKIHTAIGYIIFALIFPLFIVGWILIVTGEPRKPRKPRRKK